MAGKTGWKNEQFAKQRSFEEMSWEQSSSQMTVLQYTTHRKGLNTCLRIQPPLCAPAACRIRRGETYEQGLQQSWANLKEARNSFFGLGVYLSKSKFHIEDKLPFPWYYTPFSTYDQSLFSHWFPSTILGASLWVISSSSQDVCAYSNYFKGEIAIPTLSTLTWTGYHLSSHQWR